jgi:CubicO group peptidase (beta-lactamase class C family)
MIGAVPATYTCFPTRTTREYPARSANGDTAGTSWRSIGLVSTLVDALRQIESWPAATAAVAVVRSSNTTLLGDEKAVLAWASVTKLATALACLVAAEEGTIDLDDAAGPPGSTVRHLLAHASGLPPEGSVPIAPPGTRRIYSNAGFDELAAVVGARAEMPFPEYLRAAVLAPLGMRTTELRGSAASGLASPIADLARLAAELLRPTLVAAETLAEATEVQFPGLAGVLPGFGRQEPNDWGLGFELRDGKSPHWTGSRNSPRTFGHFGQSGGFLWVDPEAGVALGCLTNLAFGDWAKHAWPRLADAVVAEARMPV